MKQRPGARYVLKLRPAGRSDLEGVYRMKQCPAGIGFQVDEDSRSSYCAARFKEWKTPWELEPDERDVVVGLLGPCYSHDITTAFRDYATCESEAAAGVIPATGMAGLLSDLNIYEVSAHTVMRNIRLIAAEVTDDDPPKDEYVDGFDFSLWWSWKFLERSQVYAALTEHKRLMEDLSDI